LRIIVEKIAEKRGVLLPLAPAEKEIEQAFGRTHLGRQRQGANDGGSNKHTTQLALKGQLGTQRLLHPTERTSLAARGRAAKFSFTVIVDGKRALSGAEKGKEIGQGHGKRHILRPSCPGPSCHSIGAGAPLRLGILAAGGEEG
jgi:hypothetical protein